MTRSWRMMITSALLAALAPVLAGCGQAEHAGTGTAGDAPTSTSASATSAPAGTVAASQPADNPATVLADGRSPVVLKSVDAAHRSITFDLIELYLGTQAAVEWKKDHPGETDVPPLNGHYIRNNNPKLRTLPVASSVVVKVLNADGDPSASTVIAFADLPTYRGVNGVFWITVTGGAVTMFEEQFFS